MSSVVNWLLLTWLCFTLAACFLGQHIVESADPVDPPKVNLSCESWNASQSCEQCLKNVSCMWCNAPIGNVSKCMLYPVKNILPSTEQCSLSAARWGVCWVNFEALIIAMSVIGGVLIIGITLFFCKCCGCCCFGNSVAKYAREEERMSRERQERSIRQDERKKDRQRRNDDIRRKYGLMGDGDTKYQKFDNDVTTA